MTPCSLLLITTLLAATPPAHVSPHALRVALRLLPSFIDLNESPSTFEVSLSLDRGPTRPLDAGAIATSSSGATGTAGLRVSRVGGTRLPAPADGADGIEETPVPGARQRGVAVFSDPSDGDPATPDGNASDLAALLMDRSDGATVEICFAGVADGEAFEACTSLKVRNRGQRKRPARFPGWKQGTN